MNAYELADEIEKPILTRPDCLHFGRTKESMQQIANMLRQQADRIAELEKQTKLLTDEEIIKTYSEQYEKAGKLFNGGFKVNIPLMFARAIEVKIKGEK